MIKKIIVLPAHAGVIPAADMFSKKTQSPSRTRGGDPEQDIDEEALYESFPHTRG